jgi:carbon storage regulator
MLVLTREENEKILVGERIKITVVRVYPDGRVRLGIEAPDDVEIWREEIYEDIIRSGIKKKSHRNQP